MRFEELTAEQQELVNVDFGEDLEKVAAEKVATVTEMYNRGMNDIAVDIADSYDEMLKVAMEEEEEEKKKEEEEASKSDEEKQASANFEANAAELGAFIERGVFDGLQKLGSERFDDPMHYVWPYIEEKVAAAGAKAAVGKFLKNLSGKGQEAFAKAKGYGKQVGQEARMATTGKMTVPRGKHKGTKVDMFDSSGQMKGEYANLLKRRGMTPKSRGGYAKATAVRAGAAAGGAGGLGGLGYLATRKKENK